MSTNKLFLLVLKTICSSENKGNKSTWRIISKFIVKKVSPVLFYVAHFQYVCVANGDNLITFNGVFRYSIYIFYVRSREEKVSILIFMKKINKILKKGTLKERLAYIYWFKDSNLLIINFSLSILFQFSKIYVKTGSCCHALTLSQHKPEKKKMLVFKVKDSNWRRVSLLQIN